MRVSSNDYTDFFINVDSFSIKLGSLNRCSSATSADFIISTPRPSYPPFLSFWTTGNPKALISPPASTSLNSEVAMSLSSKNCF